MPVSDESQFAIHGTQASVPQYRLWRESRVNSRRIVIGVSAMRYAGVWSAREQASSRRTGVRGI